MRYEKIKKEDALKIGLRPTGYRQRKRTNFCEDLKTMLAARNGPACFIKAARVPFLKELHLIQPSDKLN